MNCKPNDLALIIRTDHVTREISGRIVRVTTPVVMHTGQQGWNLEQKLRFRVSANCIDIRGIFLPPGSLAHTEALPDEWLRPLRDNDGVDQMLLRAGMPNGHHYEASK